MEEGSYNWVDGAPLSFNGWTNPPESDGQKNCVQLTTDNGWQAVNCDTLNPFVCKTIRPGMPFIYFHQMLSWCGIYNL